MLKHVRRDTIPHLSGAPAGHLEDASSRRGRRSHGRPRSGTNHPSSKASERRCLAPRAALPRVPARDKLDSFGQILAAQGTPVPAGDPISPHYLRKGATIYVEGKLRTRKWQTQDGQDRYTTEVVVDGAGTLQMLDSRGRDEAPVPPAQRTPAAPPGNAPPAPPWLDDAIPF